MQTRLATVSYVSWCAASAPSESWKIWKWYGEYIFICKLYIYIFFRLCFRQCNMLRPNCRRSTQTTRRWFGAQLHICAEHDMSEESEASQCSHANWCQFECEDCEDATRDLTRICKNVPEKFGAPSSVILQRFVFPPTRLVFNASRVCKISHLPLKVRAWSLFPFLSYPCLGSVGAARVEARAFRLFVSHHSRQALLGFCSIPPWH